MRSISQHRAVAYTSREASTFGGNATSVNTEGRYQITVKGLVQGVGFRPFVKRLADRLGVRGTVCNNSEGVSIEIETDAEEKAEQFMKALTSEAPPIARVESCSISALSGVVGYLSFTILPSRPQKGDFTLTSPDVATCPECLKEIFDPADRRYRYAFTNCTNCGPRYSIALRVPYDRANTTMAPFIMCADCEAEYTNPADRRFHAEPNACRVCGPQLSNPLSSVIASLEQGRIVAIKGLGGFQLACGAFSKQAVETLRARKRRSRKPFAVMMRDVDTVERYCIVSAGERALLLARTAPIVLLAMREPSLFPDALAPGLHELGVMLPYTPLHHLLFNERLDCLVMTSGNISEEPIVISNRDAEEKLSSVADSLLLHNRDIFTRVDDSVVRHDGGSERVLRRSRGYAPASLDIGFDAGEILACGGELKNTFCIIKQNHAILSQHIGDLENYETLQFFEESLRNLKQVYRADPRVIAHDLHPDYLSTRWAQSQCEPKIAVQHHHAHIASCMAENGVRERVIGVAFDGTGYGTDGQIWGGEFLVCDTAGFKRAAHLRYVPLIGGDRAAREGWRMAASYLYDAFGPDYRSLDLPISVPQVFDQLLTRSKNLLTSSCGRLFDAVSAVTGVCQSSSYEGEAAMLLESVADERPAGQYPFLIEGDQIDTRPLIRAIASDVITGRGAPAISAMFHATIVAMIEEVCRKLRDDTGIDRVCLSGGTFQNFTLLRNAIDRLERQTFQVFTHSHVPPNDGGLSLGQAVIAATLIKKGLN